MSILRDFEKRLERGVEGFFARTFKSGLQPVELAKALQRYAGNYQQVGLDGVLVPNVYRFEISADDMERFSGYADALARELGDVVRRTADDNGWRLQGPVRIELRVSDTIRVGTYELRGKIEAGEGAGAHPATPPEQPAALPDAKPGPGEVVPAVPAPASSPAARASGAEMAGRTQILPTAGTTAQGVLVVQGNAGGRHRLGTTTLLGRLSDCDVTLDDPSVSRRHARIRREGEDYVIEDLRSTNGVRVNGAERDYARLSDGDELELGSVRLSFSLER